MKKQYKTLKTLKKISNDLWMLEYKDDYYLDKMLKDGKNSLLGISSFIHKQIGAKLKEDSMACTSFSAQTDDGKYIMGRNFDFKIAPCIVVWTNPKGDYKSMCCTDSNFLLAGSKAFCLSEAKENQRLMATPYSCVDGINEKGLSCALLTIKAKPTKQNTGKTPITPLVIFRAIMDKCKNVEEAIEMFSSYDLCDVFLYNYHYILSDSQGNCVIIEYVRNKMHVIRNDKEKFLVLTNFFLTKGGNNSKEMGRNRYKKVENHLKKINGIISEKDAMQLLADCTMKYHHERLPHMVMTIWSSIFNNSDKTMLLSSNMNYKNLYKFSVDKPGEFEKINGTDIVPHILNERDEVKDGE